MAHQVLPEQVRLENALNIWVRDMREQELAKVKQGGRLSVAALAYEEVLKLRGGINHILSDRRRKIKGRWERRRARRTARAARPDDILRWPDGTTCHRYELPEFSHMSDDFEVLASCGCRKGTVLCPH
jgi:hypothetical protein